MSHDPTSMNRRELQEYSAELLVFRDQQKETISMLDAEIARLKELVLRLVKFMDQAPRLDFNEDQTLSWVAVTLAEAREVLGGETAGVAP